MPIRPLVNNLPFKSDVRNEEAYPVAGLVMFGNADAHHEFAVPMARF